MAKATFQDWSTTANSNTDVGGINIAEGCPPSNINNAIREVMAQLRSGVDPGFTLVAKSANYTAVAPDEGAWLRFTASATLSLTAAATLLNNWYVFVQADGGNVIIDPNASETINGLTTITLKDGEAAYVICDGTNFRAYRFSAPATYVNKSANYTALDTDYNASIRFTSAATMAIDVTANLRANWRIEVWNDSTGLVVIDPDSTNTVNGALTLVLQPGQKIEVFRTSSTTFQAGVYGDALVIPDYVRLLTLANNSVNPNTHVDIAAGSAKLGNLIVSNTGTITKRLNATWAAGSGNGGLDTGVSAINSTYHVFAIRKQSDGSFDAVFSLSATSPTMTLLTGYDVVQRLGAIRTSGSNILSFQQTGNIFRIAETVDFTSNATVAQALMALSVPSGVRLLAMLRFQATNSGGVSDVGIITAPGDSSAITTTQHYSSNATGGVSGVKVSTGVEITNQSGQIYRSATVTGGGGQAALIHTYGWQEITIPRVG